MPEQWPESIQAAALEAASRLVIFATEKQNQAGVTVDNLTTRTASIAADLLELYRVAMKLKIEQRKRD